MVVNRMVSTPAGTDREDGERGGMSEQYNEVKEILKQGEGDKKWIKRERVIVNQRRVSQ